MKTDMKTFWVKTFRVLIVLLSKLPLRFHYFMGDVLSWLAGSVLRYRSDVVWVNLSRAFPDKKYKEIKQIYKDFYRHLGEIVAEFIWFGGSSYDRLRKHGIVRLTNINALSELYDKAPSVTLLSTHCGNWELLGGLPGYDSEDGGRLAFSEKEIYVVYKKMSSEISDRVFALNRIAPLELVGTECEVESKNILRFSIANKDRRCLYIYPVHISCRSGTVQGRRKASDRRVHASADKCHDRKYGSGMQAGSCCGIYEDEEGGARTLRDDFHPYLRGCLQDDSGGDSQEVLRPPAGGTE